MSEEEDIIQQISELYKRAGELESSENTEEYDNMLNENPDVIIGNLSYNVAEVLKCIDPIAYRCGHNDFNDPLITEVNNKIEELETQLKEVN